MAVAGLAMVLAIGGIAILLHSRDFHTYLLRVSEQKASQALGSQVQIKDFAFHWSGLGPSVILYGVVAQGAAPYENPPLLQADSLQVGVTISSFLRRSWYVNDVRIEHPVLKLFADRQGRTNIPAAKETKSDQPGANIFDLGIRHLLLERGEVYYNNERSNLSADLHDLSFQSGFDLIQQRYSGTLSYRNGHVLLQNAEPIAHNLDAHFSADAQGLSLDNVVLSTDHSRLSLNGKIEDYAQPKVHANYQGTIDAGEFRNALKEASLPVGLIQLSGVLDYASQPNRPLLAALDLSGSLRSAVLMIANQGKQVQVRNLAARYSVAKGDAEVSGIRAELVGGALSGSLTMRDLGGATKSRMSASLHGASLRDLQNLLVPVTNDQPSLQGSLNVTTEATWGKTTQDLLARADSTLQGRLQPAQGGAATPFSGVIHARFNLAAQQLALNESYVKTTQTSLTLNGTVSNKSMLQVRLESYELHELEGLASAFQPVGSTPVGIYGRASVDATVTNSTQNPQINGQLRASDLRLRGSAWKSLRTSFAANPSSIRMDQGELDPANQGRISFQLSAGLQRWSFTSSSPFELRLSASHIDAADLARASGSTTPVTGTLSADISAKGSELAPAGHGTIQLTGARVKDEPVKAVNVRFDGTGDQVNATLTIDLPAGSANANITYEPKRRAYRAQVRALGIKLDQLETVRSRNLQLNGVLNVTADGQGTLDDPQLTALVEIPRLQVQEQVIDGLKLTTIVKNHIADLNFNSHILQTEASGHGTIHLSGDYAADMAVDTQAIPLQPLLAIYAPAQAANLHGQTELHATLRGPLKDTSRIEAHLVIPQLSLDYKNTIHLAAQGPVRADFSNGILALQKSVIRGTGTEVTVQATLPAARDAQASILMRGKVDLRLAQLFDPDVTSGGEIQFDIDSYGRRGDQNVQGQVRIVNASFAAAGAPIGLQNGNGVLTLTRDRLEVTQFQGKVGGGEVTASGVVVYRPALQFDLAIAAKGVRVLYGQSLRTTIGSKLALTGSYDNALLRGQVGIEQLSFLPDFDLKEFMGELGGGDVSPPPTQGFSQNLRLEVEIETPGGLNLSSRELSLSGSASLRVRGTAAQPVLLGRMNLGGGDLIYSGNRYIIQSCTVDFRNPSRTEPVVDMSVSTTIAQYDIQMRFWGPADHLHTNYSSDPSLPPSDIINLIAFGKTAEADAANPTPPGNLGAQSLVASQVSSQVTNRIEKLAGISQLSVDPVLGSGSQSSGARIAIQQRVTGKIFVTYSADVTATQSQVIKFEYQKSRRTSFNVVRDQNGGFSFETTFRKEW